MQSPVTVTAAILSTGSLTWKAEAATWLETSQLRVAAVSYEAQARNVPSLRARILLKMKSEAASIGGLFLDFNVFNRPISNLKSHRQKL